MVHNYFGEDMLFEILAIIATYLLGSIPFGLLIGKIIKGVDIRTQGSKNIGATNVARICGFPFGILALILDLLKGLVPVLLAKQYALPVPIISLIALAAILGHVYSIYLKFKGGKAVASSMGIFLAIAPLAAVSAIVLCIIAILVSGYVSAGSILFAITLPFLLWITANTAFIPLSLLTGLLLLYKHRENIRRLLQGTEISWKKKK